MPLVRESDLGPRSHLAIVDRCLPLNPHSEGLLMDGLVGTRVRLLVDIPGFKDGAFGVVRRVLTFPGKELPEDPISLELDGTAVPAFRRDVEVVEDGD